MKRYIMIQNVVHSFELLMLFCNFASQLYSTKVSLNASQLLRISQDVDTALEPDLVGSVLEASLPLLKWTSNDFSQILWMSPNFLSLNCSVWFSLHWIVPLQRRWSGEAVKESGNTQRVRGARIFGTFGELRRTRWSRVSFRKWCSGVRLIRGWWPSKRQYFSNCKELILISTKRVPCWIVSCASSAGPMRVLSWTILTGCCLSASLEFVISLQIVVTPTFSRNMGGFVTNVCLIETVLGNQASLDISNTAFGKTVVPHHVRALLQPNVVITFDREVKIGVVLMYPLHFVVPHWRAFHGDWRKCSTATHNRVCLQSTSAVLKSRVSPPGVHRYIGRRPRWVCVFFWKRCHASIQSPFDEHGSDSVFDSHRVDLDLGVVTTDPKWLASLCISCTSVPLADRFEIPLTVWICGRRWVASPLLRSKGTCLWHL